jgi:hypothetical protein
VQELVAPRTALEEQLLQLFCQALRLEPAATSVHADFFSLGGTAIRKCVKPALLVGSLAALWAWAEAVIFFQPESDEHQSPTVEKFRAHMAGISALHDHLVTPATFVVMFSLNEALNRWQNTLTTMWALQDPIQATGFMLGSGFCRAPLKLRPLAFKLYRYLNVIHLLTYQPLTEVLSTMEVQDLVDTNLLTAKEAAHLERHNLHVDGQRRRVLAWVWDTLQDCVESGVHKKNFGRIEKQLVTIREMGSAMGSEFGRDLPFSWAQCTELIVLLVVGLPRSPSLITCAWKGTSSRSGPPWAPWSSPSSSSACSR